MFKKRFFEYWYLTTVVIIVVAALFLRLLVFDKIGGDYVTYKEAMNQFSQGINPYAQTVLSFESGAGEHGYAYLPTLLYIQYGIWLLSNFLGIGVSTILLWKIPTLVSDFLIGYLILKSGEKFGVTQNKFIRVVVIVVWLLNPYFLARFDYSLYDPLFLLFTLIALNYLETSSIKSGVFYALAISLKTIPIILLPLFLLKTPNKIKFIATGVVVFFLISLPFMRSLNDFDLYLKGAVFVHTSRELQGRPLLTTLSYVLADIGVNFRQPEFVKLYALAAIFGSALIPVLIFFKRKSLGKFEWAFISFGIYLLLTPVLSRTHLLWILPWMLIVFTRYANEKNRVPHIGILLVIMWFSMFFYLLNWNKGFEPKSDSRGKPVLVNESVEWEFMRVVRQKFYEVRGML